MPVGVSRLAKGEQNRLKLKVMLHGTICNEDFKRKAALQCWNNAVTVRNNIVTMLQPCVALKIVSCNITLKGTPVAMFFRDRKSRASQTEYI